MQGTVSGRRDGTFIGGMSKAAPNGAAEGTHGALWVVHRLQSRTTHDALLVDHRSSSRTREAHLLDAETKDVIRRRHRKRKARGCKRRKRYSANCRVPLPTQMLPRIDGKTGTGYVRFIKHTLTRPLKVLTTGPSRPLTQFDI